MSNEDIELIVLHEMAHVLGIGTLWSRFMCGKQCTIGDTSTGKFTPNQYTCNNANNEYSKIKGPDAALMISSKECANWSGMYDPSVKCHRC